jgi:hypothetical protein
MKVSETSKGIFGNSNLQLEALQCQLVTALYKTTALTNIQRKKEVKKERQNKPMFSYGFHNGNVIFLLEGQSENTDAQNAYLQVLKIHLHRMLSSDIFCGKGRHCTTY